MATPPPRNRTVIEAVNASEERLTGVMRGMINESIKEANKDSEERLTGVMRGMIKDSEERLTGVMRGMINEAIKDSEERVIGVMRGMINASEERQKASEDRLIKALRDFKTEMLKAFYSIIDSQPEAPCRN
jgi:hypothetical protein